MELFPVHIYILDIQTAKLCVAKTAAVKRLEDRSVSQPGGRLREWLRQQPIDVVDRNDIGQTLWNLGEWDPCRRVVLGYPFAYQKLMEALHRRHLSLDSAGGQLANAKS